MQSWIQKGAPPEEEKEEGDGEEMPHQAQPKNGKRKRRTGGTKFITFNGSCWNTAKAYLSRTDALVVMAQDLKLDGTDKTEAENWCKRNRWKPFITTADAHRLVTRPRGRGFSCEAIWEPRQWSRTA